MLVAGSPVAATPSTPKTITVEFTDSGPSPSAVKINAGDSVTFVNHVAQPGRTLPLLGAVQSVEVDAYGLAQSALPLKSYGSNATLRYARPTEVAYTARYTIHVVAGIVPVTKYRIISGRMRVAPALPAASAGAAGAQQLPSRGDASAGAQRPDDLSGGTVRHQAIASGSSYGYLPSGQSLTGEVRSQGVGQVDEDAGSPGLDAAPRQVPASAADPALPRVSGGDQSSVVSTQADNGAPRDDTGLGLPTIVAIVLLSVVTAALVRTLIAHRRAVPV